MKSSTIKKNINPIWKLIYPVPVSMPKDTVQPMRVEVYDDDLIGKDLIGFTQVDLMALFQSPGKWTINSILNLESDLKMQQKYKTTSFGQIYL